MRNKLKAGTAILLAMILVVVAAACSDGRTASDKSANMPDSSPSGQEEGSETKPEESAQPIDPLSQYDPPIEVTTVRAFDDSFKFVEGESLDDNIVLDLFREDMGIIWKNQWSAKNYAEKLNLAIASKDLPDIFMVDAAQFKELSEAGLLEDLSDIYEEYATDIVKEAFGYMDGVGLKMGSYKDRLYGLPETRDTTGKPNMLWIRKDWLDNLGLEVPESIDDVISVAKAFAELDPDQNGTAKDKLGIMATIGLFDSTGVGALDAFAAAYGAYPGKWVKTDSGELAFGSVQPQMKTVLEKAHELYASGALDREFALKDGGKAIEDVIAGKIGMFYAPFWAPYWPIKDSMLNDPKADWIAVPPPPGPSGDIGVPETQFAFHWFVVRKGYEHPEAIVKAINYWYDLTMDTGSRYEKFAELEREKYKDMGLGNYFTLYTSLPDINMRIALQLLEAEKSNDASKLSPAAKKTWDVMQVEGIDGELNRMVFLEGASIVKDMRRVLDEFYGSPTKTMAQKDAALGKLIVETYTKIIMGDEPISEFDAMVAKWKEIGGEQVTREVNEWANAK
ncbi:extracellular solute-binding protein [Paenibacillus sp. J5C_2022]|uniref:extracellular solute-binding protein n=1 Tax=Paenibacillus sp. J5C2022 TaxID=2977129 RepID=UPI0021CF0C90|nr:extracellular solute-binding protein [Paenibacillus sp. J5C2022]MCU6712278.1 extracellular solute-binding protein [Paenibacillus sp. J5C2022]